MVFLHSNTIVTKTQKGHAILHTSTSQAQGQPKRPGAFVSLIIIQILTCLYTLKIPQKELMCCLRTHVGHLFI